ncbi:MAG: hypothetical protein ABIQ01_03880 [Pseudolysinimonas sp.]
MPRILFVVLAVLLLAGCSVPSPDPAEPLPEDSTSSTPTPTASPEQTLSIDDPRCKLWSSPLLMLTLILHPVKDVAHFPSPALDATCRWEVAAGTNTIKYPHTYEALWLDASDATFDQVTAAFEADGATVVVDETGGPGAGYGWVTVATISSPDGSGELSLREPTHDIPARFITFSWTRV